MTLDELEKIYLSATPQPWLALIFEDETGSLPYAPTITDRHGGTLFHSTHHGLMRENARAVQGAMEVFPFLPRLVSAGQNWLNAADNYQVSRDLGKGDALRLRLQAEYVGQREVFRKMLQALKEGDWKFGYHDIHLDGWAP